MKILVIMTGGTVSTVFNEDGHLYAMGSKTVSLLAKEYAARCGDTETEFEYTKPLDIISENMTFPRLNILLDEFRRIDYDRYDGIIVTHGTDTLAYTSSLLSLALAGKTDKPIFLVSSNRTLSSSDANGYDNFAAACELIKRKFGAGVYVPYRNSDGTVYLHHGAHLRQCDNFSEDFFSRDMKSYLAAEPYGIAVEHSMLDALERLRCCVMRLEPYVGLDYSAITPSKDVLAVLHGSYHSATACAERAFGGEAYTKYSALHLAKNCAKRGIGLYLSPLPAECGEAHGVYSSTAELLKNGFVPIRGLTNECAYMKLALAYSLGYEKDEVIYFLNRDVCGEIIN